MNKRVLKFALVGASLALFNFLIYELLARLVFNNNELLWLDSIIAYCIATIAAFFMHSNITWKERHITHHGIAMFFLWNGITAVLITPFFTWIFTHLTFIYDFAHNISTGLGLPFDYEFVQSTGVFGFTTMITMIFNYFFYDRLVFDDTYFGKVVTRIKSHLHRPTKSQFFAFLLYLLPVIFSVATVTLITTSGEDNFQGAGNYTAGVAIDSAQDAINAFNFNSRLTDMYAWTVIDYYDYQFAFGLDTIFRLLDVIMITAVFYFATYLVLSRRPRLTVKNALVFCAIFSFFIITPFGRAFYHEFSMIHNYVPLALVTLIFSIPYVNLATSITKSRPQKSSKTRAQSLDVPRHPLFFACLMLILGVIFGMSATITPIAFLATVTIFSLIRHKSLTRPPLWFWAGILGAITGFLICWLAGSGVDHYTDPTTAATFDYLPLSDVFSNFPRLIYHEIYNFGITFTPIIGIALLCLPFLNSRRTIFSKSHLTHLSPKTLNFLLIFVLFSVIHVLGASLVKSPPRLLIPAYLAGIILVFHFTLPYLKFRLVTPVLVFFTTVIVIVHIVLLAKYHREMTPVLDYIKNSDSPTLCIPVNSTRPTRIPVIDLAQANILVDWGIPEPIYNKGVINCE